MKEARFTRRTPVKGKFMRRHARGRELIYSSISAAYHAHRHAPSRTRMRARILGSGGFCKVVPILEVVRRESEHHSPLTALACSTVHGVASGIVVVTEQMQLANMIWDRDPMHSTGA
jgi:hypothetical protein